MAIRPSTTPARAGERSRSPSALYGRALPTLEPDEPAPGTPEPWHVVEPIRPDTPHVRAPRVLDIVGEFISAAFIIGGGLLAYGVAAPVA